MAANDAGDVMPKPMFETTALVGTGVIGRSWSRVFVRGGCRVRLYDPDPEQAKRAVRWFHEDVALDVREGFVTKEDEALWRDRVTAHADLRDALTGAGYVQESGPERLDLKRAIYQAMDAAAEPDAILASSTSALDVNEFADRVKGGWRCITAHPVNPPHIVPLVEIQSSRETKPAVQEKTIEFLAHCGQKPVVLKRYINGFLLNRIQAAVVREAFHLAESGVADAEAIDSVIKDGLALRWAFIGNFGANHLNAPEGIGQYFGRYADAYRSMIGDLKNEPPAFEKEMMSRIAREIGIGENEQDVKRMSQWRDRMIVRLKALKKDYPRP